MANNPASSGRHTNTSLVENVRTARQLRPPPIAASPWSQYAGSPDSGSHGGNVFQPASSSFNRFPGQGGNNNNPIPANRYYKDSHNTNSNSNEFHPLVNLYSNGNSVADLPKHPTYTLSNSQQQQQQSDINNYHRPSSYDDRDRNRDRPPPAQQRPKEFDYFPPNYKTTPKTTPAHYAPFNVGGAPISSHNVDGGESDNFSYYHHQSSEKKNSERDHRKINPPEYSNNKVPNVAILPNATPKNHFISFSTVGGFFNNNNHPSTTPATNFDNYKNKYRTSYNTNNNDNGPASQPLFENVDGSRFNNYYPTTPATNNNEFQLNYNHGPTTAKPSFFPSSTTVRHPAQAEYDPDFYSSYMNQVQKNKGPAFNPDYHSTTTTPRPNYYISQLTEKTFLSPSERPISTKTSNIYHRPAIPSATPGPVVGVDFDFNKFIERIRQDQLSNLKAGIDTTTSRSQDSASVTLSTKLSALPHQEVSGYYSGGSAKPTQQPNKFFTAKYATTLGSEEYYYDDEDDVYTTSTTTSRPTTRATTTPPPPPSTTMPTTTRAPKGYEQFIKSIPKPVTKLQPIGADDHHLSLDGHPAAADDDDEYYYDDDDDDEYDFHVPPPNKYMPVSETRSPRPTTPYPGPKSPPSSRPPLHTESIVISTPRPIFGIRTEQTTTPVPSIIQFPKDIFQDIQPLGSLPRYLNNATNRPYTIRTRLVSTNPETTTTVRQTTLTTTTTTSTTTTPTPSPTTTVRTSGNTNRYTSNVRSTTARPSTTTTRKVYTIRPYRGQPKWKNAKSVKGSDTKNQLDVEDKTQPSR